MLFVEVKGFTAAAYDGCVYASAQSAVQASNVLECIVCDSGLTKYAIIHLILDIGT